MTARYFNKSKPMPAWVAAMDAGGTRRQRYWRRLWDAQPAWADVRAIKAVYAEAARRRRNGEWVVVDHIVPLNGADICGLHAPANLRVITHGENSHRGNAMYPGQPCAQLDIFRNWHAPIDFELEPSL